MSGDLSDVFAGLKAKKKQKEAATAAAAAVPEPATQEAAEPTAAAAQAPPAKRRKKLATKDEKPEVAAPTAAGGHLSDAQFFDLRGGGETAGVQADSAMTELLEASRGPKRFVAVANLEPSVQRIYEHTFQEKLAALGAPEKLVVDWGTHAVRMHYAQADDAFAAAALLNKKKVYGRTIKTGLAKERECEVLVRSLMSHVTEDVLQHYLQRYGTILNCQLLSFHSMYSKAFVLFSDEADAQRCVKHLNGAMNTVQDGAIQLSTIYHESAADATSKGGKGKSKGGKGKGAKGDKGEGDNDDASDDGHFVYNQKEGF